MRKLLILAALALFVVAPYTRPARADVGLCAVFPADNYWNRDISADPVHPQSAAIIATINSFGGDYLHPDFGGVQADYYGIPWVAVTDSQLAQPLAFYPDDEDESYPDQSDEGNYPIPFDAPIEGGPDADGDQHVIAINTDSCTLYELYNASVSGTASSYTWTVSSAAIFDLNSNALRPEGWTSADAAGLPIFPGLARCDEASTGAINHALRFTVSRTQDAYVFPARHSASNYTNPLLPPMGARFRLRADYDLSGLTGQALVVARALQRYGMIVADNGSNWFISGDYPYHPDYPTSCVWDDDALQELKDIPGTAFEVLAYPGDAGSYLNHFATLRPTLTWTRVTWAVAYEVQIDEVATFASPTTYSATGTSYTFTSDLAEDTYYWRVRAQDSNGVWGAWSAAGTFVVAIIP
jgi:hypothetical protein